MRRVALALLVVAAALEALGALVRLLEALDRAASAALEEWADRGRRGT